MFPVHEIMYSLFEENKANGVNIINEYKRYLIVSGLCIVYTIRVKGGVNQLLLLTGLQFGITWSI